MESKKKLPIGVEFFQDFIKEDFYYVDKTGFIRDLMQSRGSVNLFTRPRRFGKSLNMDMLKNFFEIGADPALFAGLEIEQEAELCRQHLGQHPVISISLKDISGSSYPAALKKLSRVLQKEIRRHQYLLHSKVLSSVDKASIKPLFASFLDEDTQEGSLALLSEMLYRHHKQKVLILIDEYDVPLDKAHQKHYYSEMVEHIRALFSEALKSNESLYFAVITGCLRIARESIFTGLNNFKVRSLSDTDYAEYFGFTDAEVRTMLAYYNLEDTYDRMKEWYDGYHIGQVEVYCPWDVINQCDKFRTSRYAPMESHWENSSSNTIIQEILEHATATTKDQIEALISGETIEKTLMPDLTYTDLASKDTEIRQTYLWSILFAAGYLTETERSTNGVSRLAIPNREILGIYERKIRSWFTVRITSDIRRWKCFCLAVKNGTTDEIQTILNEFLSDSISIRDTSVKRAMKENFYHGMLLGLLQAEGSWIVKSNIESGIGYTDISIEIPSERIGCIIEVKYAERGQFDLACQKALHQIEQNNYTQVLQKKGLQTIYRFGIAFYQKSCQVVSTT